MTDRMGEAGAVSRPTLRGARVTIRPGDPDDVASLGAVLAEESVTRFLVERRGHHRITIDPAAANQRAIRCYQKAGFRPVGVMRQYEFGTDGRFHDGLLMDLIKPWRVTFGLLSSSVNGRILLVGLVRSVILPGWN